MSYKQEYERWLHSDALSPAEHAELERIAGDEKEIENRFYGPLEFGTAGLRGTMKVGLHQMNIHVIRWATQGFANVIAAEGEDAKKKGVAICMDCRNNNMLFSHAAAEVCAANGIHVRIFESLRPTPELSFAVRYYGCQASMSPPATTPRSITATRSTGLTAPSCRPSTPTPSPPSWKRSTSSPASSAWTLTRR